MFGIAHVVETFYLVVVNITFELTSPVSSFNELLITLEFLKPVNTIVKFTESIPPEYVNNLIINCKVIDVVCNIKF